MCLSLSPLGFLHGVLMQQLHCSSVERLKRIPTKSSGLGYGRFPTKIGPPLDGRTQVSGHGCPVVMIDGVQMSFEFVYLIAAFSVLQIHSDTDGFLVLAADTHPRTRASGDAKRTTRARIRQSIIHA